MGITNDPNIAYHNALFNWEWRVQHNHAGIPPVDYDTVIINEKRYAVLKEENV